MTCQVPYELINFVELYVFLFLNKRQNGSTEKDVWKFESQKELWDEFIVNYQQLIDNNTSFYHEYNYELEVRHKPTPKLYNLKFKNVQFYHNS